MTKLAVPEAVLHQHVAVLGKTRSGKSSVMRGLVENLLDREQPVCIVDPKGDWWGIKLAKDGKRPGYPVVIFGGEHADVPINAHAGAHVAELFATGNRPCLIDLGGWMVGDRTRFWIDFASALFRHTKGTRWLVVDEIHNFAPKGKIMDVDAGKALHWTNRLASEGLGKGLPMLFASQRPQKVHNDTLTSAETLIAMRVLHPSDRAAVSDWIKGCGDMELGTKVLNSLAQMDRGEGWAWSPEIGFGPERVKFPMFKTYDSFRPQTADDAKALKGWAEVDLEEVKAKLATVVKQAEENDPRLLRAEISRLRKQISDGPQAQQIAQEQIQQAEFHGFKRGKIEGYRDGVRAFASHVERARDLDRRLAEFHESVREFSDDVEQWLKKESSASPTASFEPPPHPPSSRASLPGPTRREQRHAAGGSNLPVGELAIMKAVAQYPAGAGRDQLSVLTGYKRSTRNAYLQRLETKGFVELRNESIFSTPEGLAALGSDYEPLPTGAALRDYWLARLPDGERAILRVLIERYPSAVPRDLLSSDTGYKRSTRNAYLQRLAARRLVDNRGENVTASEVLFQ